MHVRLPALTLAVAGLFAACPQDASAADAVLVVPVGRPVVIESYGYVPAVPRVKPASRTKRYPFGVLREDYTPYGMAGVPDRLYFTARARDLR